MRGKFADQDTKITPPSATPLSARAPSNPALNCTAATTAGMAPCHSYNLPACFSSQASSFSLFFSCSHTRDSTAQIALPLVRSSGSVFPLPWEDSAWGRGHGCGSLGCALPRPAQPLTVGSALPCSGSPAQGRSQGDGARPWARPQLWGGRPTPA